MIKIEIEPKEYQTLPKEHCVFCEQKTRYWANNGDIPRVELFCRYPADGWDVWGNEVKSTTGITSALSGCQKTGTAYA